MEPLFFKAENNDLDHDTHNLQSMLQWSRFFSKRKILSDWVLAPAVRLEYASMEPLFFKAENCRNARNYGPIKDGLQWSRFFSKRKIRPEKHDARCQSGSFNGAAFFQSGKCT